MMIVNPLSSAEKAVLKAELQLSKYAAMSNQQAADSVSSPTMIPNPVPQGQVPKPFDAPTLLAILTKSKPALPLVSFASAVLDAFNASDIPRALNWCATLEATGVIISSESAALQARINQTMPDPNWQATIQGPRRVTQLYGSGKTWQIKDDVGNSLGSVDCPPIVSITEARA